MRVIDIESLVASALIAFTLFGCGGGPEAPGSLDIRVPPHQVALGEEVVRCFETALPSGADIDVARITVPPMDGMHHVHLYVSAGGAKGAPERTYDCPDAVSFADWHLLIAVQANGLDWTLPEGAAIHVDARRSLLVQTHWLNTGSSGDRPLTAAPRVTLGLARSGSVARRVGTILGENLDIDIPPHSTGSVGGQCALPGPGDLLSVMGHYHVHGRRFSAVLSGGGEAPSTVYDSEESPELPFRTFDDVRVPDGARLDWSCTFDNNLDAPLQTGPLVGTQEHCAMFAFYTLDAGEAGFVPCVVGEE